MQYRIPQSLSENHVKRLIGPYLIPMAGGSQITRNSSIRHHPLIMRLLIWIRQSSLKVCGLKVLISKKMATTVKKKTQLNV